MITVEQVQKYYGAHAAVRGLDFAIARGECVGLLGLNGAGKSTTLKLLGGMLPPTSGRITVDGVDTDTAPELVRAQVGYLPETPPLYAEMTVREQLRFAGGLRGMGAADLDRRIGEVAKACDLGRVLDVPLGTLSHGFQQRAGIAQAILHEPALLILDEPTQGLDPVQIAEVRQLIRELRGRHTILLSTHILSEIEAVCDRILVLHEGEVAAQGTEAELVARYGGAGGGAVEAEVRGPTGEEEATIATLEAALSGLPQTGLEVRGEGAGVVRVRIEGQEDVRAAVSRAVVGADLDLLALRRVRSGLEEMFINLGRGRDAGGRS